MNPTPDTSTRRRFRDTWVVAAVVALVGVWITLAALSFEVSASRQAFDEELDAAGTSVVHRFDEITSLLGDRLVAVQGLVHASDFVSAAEFRDFVGDLGLAPGTIGIGYVTEVPHEELAAFLYVASTQHEGFRVFGLDEGFHALPIDDTRPSHQVLTYAEPVGTFEQMIGLDIGSLPTTRATLDRAVASESIHATAPFAPSPQFDGDELLVIEPILESDGDVIGHAVALLDLSDMVAVGLADHVRDGDQILVSDVTGTVTDPPLPGRWFTVFSALGRQWRVEVVPGSVFTVWSPFRLGAAALGLIVSIGAGVLVAAIVEARRARAKVRQMTEASKQTDRLLGIVSHELRTPLTSIIGFLDELRHNWDRHDDAERHELVALADAGAGEIASLVADLLVRERIISQTPLAVSPGPVALSDAFSRVVAELPSDRVAHVEIQPTPVVVIADPLRLRQIIRNLVSNAFRYGRAPVRFLVEEHDDGVEIRFADAGDGVRDCCLPHLFDLGPAPCAADHDQVDSHGFGLPVSQFIARSMGGGLDYDQGTGEFVLTLPNHTESMVVAA